MEKLQVILCSLFILSASYNIYLLNKYDRKHAVAGWVCAIIYAFQVLFINFIKLI